MRMERRLPFPNILDSFPHVWKTIERRKVSEHEKMIAHLTEVTEMVGISQDEAERRRHDTYL
jgi:hypothetical protein